MSLNITDLINNNNPLFTKAMRDRMINEMNGLDTRITDNTSNISTLQNSEVDLQADRVYTANVFITRTQILLGNTELVTIVPGVVDKIIVPVGQCIMKSTFNSVAYATNTNSTVGYEAVPFYTFTGTLGFTTDIITGVGLAVSTEYSIGGDIVWQVDTGDPTGGNSDIQIIMQYKIVDPTAVI